jgi:hypothetical protein
MYQVEWDTPALDDLAELCIQHPTRWADINGAVDIIKYRLERDPVQASQAVAEGLRRIKSSPLAAEFPVNGPTATIESLRRVG